MIPKSDKVSLCDRTLTFKSEHLLKHPKLGVNLSHFHDKEHSVPCNHLANHLVCELLRFQVAHHWLLNNTVITISSFISQKKFKIKVLFMEITFKKNLVEKFIGRILMKLFVEIEMFSE